MRFLLALLGVLPTWVLFAQNAGDLLFDTDQVIEMRFTFDEEDFFTQLMMDHMNGGNLYLPATVQITDNTGTYVLDSVGVRLKGNSTFDFMPTMKKPIKVDFNEFVAGQNYHGLKMLNLANGWSDPTLIREKVFFDACRRAGVPAPRVSFANVYLNDLHWGLYGAVEQVDKTFLDRWLPDNDGNLFKAGDNYSPDGGGIGLEADLNYYGPNASDHTGRYDLKTNTTQNDWSDLIALLDLIDNTANSQLLSELPEAMDLPTVLRSLALDNLYGNMDAYYGTARNYYLYHDSTTFKWHWIKWDANMAFGRYVPQWIDDPATLPATYTSPGRRLLQRVMAIPALRQAYLIEFCSVLDDLTNADLDPRIDALHELLLPYVEADGNKEYSTGLFTLNMTQTVTAQSGQWWNTMPGLKSFIAQRRAALTGGSLNCATVGLEELAATTTLSAWPNPTTGPVTVSLQAGQQLSDLVLMDAQGRMVQPQVTHSGLDLSGLPAGLYILMLHTDDGTSTVKLEKH